MSDKEMAALVAEAADTQVKDLNQTVNRLHKSLNKEKDRTDAITGALYEAVRDGLAGLDFPDFNPPKKDRRTKKDDEIAICVLSDWQLGKKTPTYSSEVCEERIKHFCEKASLLVDIQRMDHPVKKVALFLVGDMVEGELIFPGQAWQIDSSLYQQVTIDGPRILSAVVHWASSFFEEVEVYCVPGNHGSLAGRARREMHPESNADRMLYQIVSQLTASLDNVTWNIAKDVEWIVADLGEKSRFYLLHGEDVRSQIGIPWYGWTRKVLGIGSLERINPEMAFDHMIAGHFHTPTTMYINGRRLWINASTESQNQFAARYLSAAGEPAQWLLFSKPGRGVTAEYLVDLS